jgi:hypothetical protein
MFLHQSKFFQYFQGAYREREHKIVLYHLAAYDELVPRLEIIESLYSLILIGLVEGTFVHDGAVGVEIVEEKCCLLRIFPDFLKDSVELVFKVAVHLYFLDARVNFSFTKEVVLDISPAFVHFPFQVQVQGAFGFVVFWVVIFYVANKLLCEAVLLLETMAHIRMFGFINSRLILFIFFGIIFVLLLRVSFLLAFCIFVSIFVIFLIVIVLGFTFIILGLL